MNVCGQIFDQIQADKEEDVWISAVRSNTCGSSKG